MGQQGPGNGANHSNSRNTTTALHLGTPSNTVTSSQFGSSLSVTATDDTNQPPTGFSQAYEDGLSIPTSKFNTAAFGTIRFPTLPTQSATTPAPPTSTATAPVLNQYDPDGIDMCDDLGNFDDDFDDDFMQTEVVVNKNNHGLETGNTMSQTGPPPSQNGSVGSGDISIGEASILKQRLAEMEQQLKSTQEELMIKSGQASVLKDRLDSESQAHGELKERFRVADTQHQTEMESMKEKHQKEISNINMNHQFEVQSYIAARQVNTAAPSSTQSLRNTAPPSPTPQFPKPFSLFPSTQSSIKTQPGRDDGFSVSNFTVTPRSPRKSRTVGLNSNATIERKPRPPQFVPDPSKTVSHFDGLRGDIPTRSDEELIRDKLLAGHENSFGFPNLLVMNKDENQLSPLPGSQEYANNAHIERLAESCRVALSNLTLVVDSRSKLEALKATTNLLQSGIIIRKPRHIVNALHILITLYRTYEDISDDICRGSVPFIENDREDPLKVVPSEASLPSALACIYYLFLTRIALPLPPPCTPIFPSMKRDYRLPKDAEEHLDTTLFLFMNLVAARLVNSKTPTLSFSPLIRRRIFIDMLRLHLNQRHYGVLERILTIIGIVTRDAEYSRMFIGWSISQGKWTMEYSHVDMLFELVKIQAADPMDMTNGVIPQIKIQVLEIVGRLLRVNAEQTKTIIVRTNLFKIIIYLIRELVDLAETIHYHKSLASVCHGKGLQYDADGMAAIPATPALKVEHPFATPKMEPFASGSVDMFSSTQASSTFSRTMSLAPAFPMASGPNHEGAAAGSSSRSIPRLRETWTTSFHEPIFNQVSNKPSAVNRPLRTMTMMGAESGTRIGGTGMEKMMMMRDGLGSREVRAFMSKTKTQMFDCMVVLRMAIELILGILRSLEGSLEHLRDKEPVEYQILVYAMSKMAVGDVGLPTDAQDLARDVLGELVLDEAEEMYFLSLVKE